MKKLNLNQMEKIEGGKFWGKEYSCVQTGTDPVGGYPVYYECDNVWRFWINFGPGCAYVYGCSGQGNTQS
jgi:hypothetical protein